MDADRPLQVALAFELLGAPRMKMLLASLPILALVHTAAAQPADRSVSPTATRTDPNVAITVSPLHLIIPMAEVTAEFRVAPKLGVAVIAGAGVFREQTTNERITLLEGGVSARYYV